MTGTEEKIALESRGQSDDEAKEECRKLLTRPPRCVSFHGQSHMKRFSKLGEANV